ncbi:unnamed protein product [Bemisia tabaci]|uniref:Syndecan n=1 Tax=Bemisia tabaci TaxID=7038 RepID=A0A9P0AL71_BEMTA|nr:PREDICTED: syndecan-like [Bemisia tabaci]CAH0393952.1 unnamed protein product [Bemisia tabaci]
MYFKLCIIIYFTSLCVGLTYTSSENRNHKDWSSSLKDDIYMDDDEPEGSGQREIKDDLESSGSGYGPDDEDGEGGSGININKQQPTKTKTIVDENPPPSPVDQENVAVRTQNVGVEFAPNGGTGVNEIGPPPAREPTDVEATDDNNRQDNDVTYSPEDRATSFFAQPGILAAVFGGAVVGLLCAILVVMFIVYRMRKKDEGSYALEEPKRSPTSNSYTKNSHREFYA